MITQTRQTWAELTERRREVGKQITLEVFVPQKLTFDELSLLRRYLTESLTVGTEREQNNRRIKLGLIEKTLASHPTKRKRYSDWVAPWMDAHLG
ncbi:MAG: hypothetical protein NXI04_22085 [Planctomycetaceae bacterium]|nr:hypothetical protein [Planctomycetaceae bacterium]